MRQFKYLNQTVRDEEARILRDAGRDVQLDASLNVVERRKYRRLRRLLRLDEK